METGNNEIRMQLALWFSLHGDLRFLSHHDTMRLWQRAFTRAQFPIRYSSGFNPHMRMSLPLPRSVGMACRRELLLAEWQGTALTAGQHMALQKELPAGLAVREASLVPAHRAYQPQWAVYRLQLGPQVDGNALQARIEAFLQKKECTIVRPAHGRHPKRKIPARTCLAELRREGDSLFYKLLIQPKGTIRLDEIAELLEIQKPGDILGIERLETEYHTGN